MSNMMRITGLATGLDVDSMVKQMMKAQSARLDKVKQDRQVVQWKQDLYREVLGDLNALKSTYYDVLKPDTYILSANNYAAFDTSNKESSTNSIATASAGAGATTGVYNIKNITVAAKASMTGSNIMKVKEAGSTVAVSIKSTDITVNQYDSLTIGLNGEEYKINLTGDYTSIGSLAADINNKLKTANKSGEETDISSLLQASVSSDGMSVQFIPATGNTLNQILKSDSITTLEDNKLAFNLNIESGVNDKLTININGTSTDITFAGSYSNLLELTDAINTKLNDAGIGDAAHGNKLQAKVSLDGSRIQFINQSDSDQISIRGSASSMLGFSSTGFDIYASTKDRFSSLFSSDSDVNVSFTVNNTLFSYDFSSTGADKNKTISEIINEVSSKAGIKISYSELGRKFTIESNSTGSGQKLTASQSAGTFLNTLFGVASIDKTGSDAKATITDPKGNSATVIKSNNTFTVDGMTYNLLKDDSSVSGIDITVTSNAQKVFDKIKAFIDKYNENIDKIQDKIREKKQYSYKPLTDEQKKEMSEDEIKSWESKAKQGLMQNDSSLQNMLYAMRGAFFDKVEGAGISLSDIGITTDVDYTTGGKIVIDEAKLKSAIQNNGDQVASLFMKDSTISYDPDHINDKDRYKQIGIFQRINDVLKDYTRTSRNSNGQKGILIERAGIKGDLSEIENQLSKDLKNNYDKRISELTQKMISKETKYYEQFARLETAIQKMNQQSSWLAQQFGGSQ